MYLLFRMYLRVIKCDRLFLFIENDDHVELRELVWP